MRTTATRRPDLWATILAWLCGLISTTSPPVARAAEDQPPAAPVRIVLIGDSTVKNGSGRGDGGLWGWGQVLSEFFDPAKAVVENRALGGRSSRTYLTEGLWERSLERLRPGDFVLMQFGHNDGAPYFTSDRPRGSIKGNGDESESGVVEMTGRPETVRSYGWYLRKYVADAQAKGATPIVLSLVPRNIWRDGRVVRAGSDYGRWAREAAEQGGASFVDLNAIVARRYEELGQQKVASEFFTAADHTHTTQAGAQVNAQGVVEGLRGLADCPLAGMLVPEGDQTKETSESGSQGKSAAAIDSLRDGAGVDRPQFHFRFGDVGPADATFVADDARYSAERGYGWEVMAKLVGGDLPAASSRFFAVRMPEGNYRVSVEFGDLSSVEHGAVKAELRRLLAEVTPASPKSWEFTVNVRTPAIDAARRVRLKPREETTEAAAWDDKLTLEFCRTPLPVELSIRAEPTATTVFLAGDSTVADQPLEPWNSWGQMLPRFFAPGTAVANHSESGESVRSSLGAGRFDKIFAVIQPGDWLLVQFGHNDMKNPAADAVDQYARDLQALVERTRAAGATPVLITSMERKSGVTADTLDAYPAAVRFVAAKTKTPCLDLHAASKRLYRALGADLDRAFQDGTHHTSYGSDLLARCIAAELRREVPALAARLRPETPPFDLAAPPKYAAFTVPPSPAWDPAATPQGN